MDRVSLPFGVAQVRLDGALVVLVPLPVQDRDLGDVRHRGFLDMSERSEIVEARCRRDGREMESRQNPASDGQQGDGPEQVPERSWLVGARSSA